jgi:hypothetical protein
MTAINVMRCYSREHNILSNLFFIGKITIFPLFLSIVTLVKTIMHWIKSCNRFAWNTLSLFSVETIF